LVVGQARFSPAAIIELKDEAASKIQTREQKSRFIDENWPFAVEANKTAPAHVQLAQDRIMRSTDGKPFLRAGKGTVLRPVAIKLYEQEIDELYRRSDNAGLLICRRSMSNRACEIWRLRLGS